MITEIYQLHTIFIYTLLVSDNRDISTPHNHYIQATVNDNRDISTPHNLYIHATG